MGDRLGLEGIHTILATRLQESENFLSSTYSHQKRKKKKKVNGASYILEYANLFHLFSSSKEISIVAKRQKKK